jgi:hypothetical protein
LQVIEAAYAGATRVALDYGMLDKDEVRKWHILDKQHPVT